MLRVALIASARFPIREPFAGGLEAHTSALAKALSALGHEVTVFAAPGSDPDLGVSFLPMARPEISSGARADVSMGEQAWLDEHHAYLTLMLELTDQDGRFDVIHNNCLHYLPVAMAPSLSTAMVTTLHTPPTPWLESAIQARPSGRPTAFVTVSGNTARAWRHLVPDPAVIHNGVDLRRWTPGPGGGPLFWSGRIVPEKGTHLAIDAARRAGWPLDIAGDVLDRDYFDREVAPRLGGSIRYLGHLTQTDLAARVAAASAVLVTPCWDEPYGLVAAEALACGTPVAGFAVGAISELVTEHCATLVGPGDTKALAEAIQRTVALRRSAARDRAVAHCSQDRMVSEYVGLYHRLAS